MCKIHSKNKRYGSSLQHGRAHKADHDAWSRRDFLAQMALGGAATSFMLGSTPVQAYARHSMFESLRDIETDRILVLVQLTGGNDGLNTIVPINNDFYYQRRPSISIGANETVKLNNKYGMHPMMSELEPLWGDGKFGIIHGVGYPDPTLSHFRSKDIWATGSGADDFLNTGWAGRAFDSSYPDYALNPPDFPLAVQLGSAASVILQGPVGPMGMNILSDNIFERLAEGGNIYDETDVPNSIYGQELAFARTISNDSYQYAGRIFDAMSAGDNAVEYPGNNDLGSTMSKIARMIKGGLPTHIYLVGMTGFDTHSNQLARHETLIENLSGAVSKFYEDLKATRDHDRVLIMTFSEFGRRVEENGSKGTDHGEAAPVMVFGGEVAGGFYGTHPDLDNTNGAGNLAYSTDFRTVYSSVLQDWFGFDSSTIQGIFGGSFGIVPFIEGSTGDGGDGGGDGGDGGGDGGDGGGDGGSGGGDGGDGGGDGGSGGGDGGDGGSGGGDGGDGSGGDDGSGGGGDGGSGGGDGGGGDGGGGDDGNGETGVGVGEENAIQFALDQNYPNPFRGRTRIEFELPTTMRTDITVYDMTGRRVEVLVQRSMSAGRHSVHFDAGNLPSGTYICRLTTPKGTAVRRMTLVR